MNTHTFMNKHVKYIHISSNSICHKIKFNILLLLLCIDVLMYRCFGKIKINELSLAIKPLTRTLKKGRLETGWNGSKNASLAFALCNTPIKPILFSGFLFREPYYNFTSIQLIFHLFILLHLNSKNPFLHFCYLPIVSVELMKIYNRLLLFLV